MTRRAKILWGVCGIGNGHAFRQLPLIEHFAKEADIMIFAYENTLDFLKSRFKGHNNVRVAPVGVTFFAGDDKGLDFEATAAMPQNNGGADSLNVHAMAEAARFIGTPDLVVSDYEPISAQYAYAHNAPLVTFDQQSKYLIGDFTKPLNGQSCMDEIMRLRMFFPKADARIACSFFNVAAKPEAQERVEIVAPVLQDNVLRIVRKPATGKPVIMVYISSQKPFEKTFDDVIDLCKSIPEAEFHLFGKGLESRNDCNVHVYGYGDPRFHDVLSRCNGIVSTAGHMLLSEAMHLGIPVYAVPFALYEQQMNADVIETGGFGVSRPSLDAHDLRDFISGLPRYAEAIKADRTLLLRGGNLGEMAGKLRAHLKL